MKSYPGDDKTRELILAGKWEEARDLLESVIEVFEGASAKNDLALVLAKIGECSRAHDLIDQAESQLDADARVTVNKYFISQLVDFDDHRGEDAAKKVIDLTRGDVNLKPRLSIIMRTYNRSKLIIEAARSALFQKYSDFELVIVNDGGDREVDKAVERVWDKRVVYAYAVHSGPSGAFNVGLRLARGEFISFLDDDDVVYPEHYSRLIEHLDVHPEVKAVYTDLKLVWKDAESDAVLREKAHIAGPFEADKLWTGFYIMNLMSLVLRRECLEKVPGFLEGLQNAVDWEFMLALSKFYGFEYLPEVGGELRYREGLSQVGKRSVNDHNLMRNLIIYYYGRSPFYSWVTGRGELTEKFMQVLAGFLKEHSDLIPALELRKLYKEHEYSLFYQLGRELQKAGRNKEAFAAYIAAAKLAPYEARIWGKVLSSRFGRHGPKS